MSAIWSVIASDGAAFIYAALGFVSLGRSVVLGLRRRRSTEAEGPSRARELVRSIRAALVGSAFVGLGAGLFHDIDWLVSLAVIIGCVELLETTVMSLALRDEVARRRAQSGFLLKT